MSSHPFIPQPVPGDFVDHWPSLSEPAPDDLDGPTFTPLWARAGLAAPPALPPLEVPTEPMDTPLALIVERVRHGTSHLSLDPADVALLVEETLWQIGWLIRRGARVEVPELGTFQRATDPAGAPIVAFEPAPILLTPLWGVSDDPNAAGV